MRYLGSKTLLLNEIYMLIYEHHNAGIICDPFGGIGTVGKYMKEKGYQVITGDILEFANCFQVAQIVCNDELGFNKIRGIFNINGYTELENFLNNLKPEEGWLVTEYSKKRMFFTEINAMKIQACIDCIWSWHNQALLTEIEYKVLIASLIQSADKIANTAGTYYAYLKDYYRKAKKEFYFKMLYPVKGNEMCRAYLEDANALVEKCQCDVLYLDPPYNERNYGRYYHLPETFARGKMPVPKGKSGVYMPEEKASVYNNKKKATDAFEKLIKNATAKTIIFHYTDEGLINKEDVRDILNTKGIVEEFYFDSKGYITIADKKKCQHHVYRVRK